MVTTKWLASLSDGTTAIEGISPFAEIDGELSPWQKLMAHISTLGLRITGLRIQVSKTSEATRTYNLPNCTVTPKGNHERWNTLSPIQPSNYNYFRWVTQSMTGEAKKQIEIRAYYPTHIVSLFVDEDEGNESWVVVHKKE